MSPEDRRKLIEKPLPIVRVHGSKAHGGISFTPKTEVSSSDQSTNPKWYRKEWSNNGTGE
jgi:hypothetical protein